MTLEMHETINEEDGLTTAIIVTETEITIEETTNLSAATEVPNRRVTVSRDCFRKIIDRVKSYEAAQQALEAYVDRDTVVTKL